MISRAIAVKLFSGERYETLLINIGSDNAVGYKLLPE